MKFRALLNKMATALLLLLYIKFTYNLFDLFGASEHKNGGSVFFTIGCTVTINYCIVI